ncbi:hypothetical protein, partial [Novosphingobium umbonatum]|uniref:hypothetical protein n=1 Tax=Novosphingobium umbonatum TaxID=1908524 RepID=UPI0013E3E7B5
DDLKTTQALALSLQQAQAAAKAQAMAAKVDPPARQEVMQSPPQQQQPQPLVQPGFVVGALNRIEETRSFIFSRDGQFHLAHKAVVDMGLDDQFFKGAGVQMWLKQLYEPQQADLSVFMAHLEEQPDQFHYAPGQSGFL